MNSAQTILTHDLGTSGNKASLYGADGTLLAATFFPYETFYPHTGWAEQDPADWWRAVCACTHRLLSQAHIAPAGVACVSFSGQMQACLPVDAHGLPLRRCIIWADQRSTDQAALLDETVGSARVFRLTGARITPTYSATKILWVRDREPDVFAQTHKFLHVKDYITYRLTGRFVTERSDASGMNLYDLEGGGWSAEILDAVGLDESLLPRVHNSTDVAGTITPEAAEEVGLRAGTPVVAGAGDGICAAVGSGAVCEGLAYNYIGSSAWIALTSSRPLIDPGMRVVNYAHMIPGKFMPCGSMQSAGGSYQWLRRQVCTSEAFAAEQAGIDVYDLMSRKAALSPPGANHLIFLPYLMGERSPYWDPQARGAYVGLTVKHTREDIIRATLEGITCHLKLILEVYREAGVEPREIRVIGGGGKSRFWRQLMADIYGIPVLAPRLMDEATSLGAAIAGGVGAGLLPGFSAVERFVEIVERHAPNPEVAPVYEQRLPLFEAAYRALAPINAALHAIES